jgi:hypothetical protein
MKQPTEYILKVGESAKIKPGLFSTSYSLVYAGMLSDHVYSVVVTWSSGQNSAAYNLYLDKDQREINMMKGRLTVFDVNKSEIRFQFQK